MFALVATLLSASVHASEPASLNARRIVLATGSPLGIYFAVGNGICRLIEMHHSERARDVPFLCAATASAGSLANLQALRTGRVGYALVQSDWHRHASEGTGRFAGRRIARMRSVMSLHAEVFHLIVGRDTAVASFDGLAGRRVNLGPAGSGHRGTFEQLLAATGRTPDWFGTAMSLDVEAQIPALCTGDLDAMSVTIGMPSRLVSEALERCQGRLLAIADAGKLIASQPYYVTTSIEPGTYPGQREPIDTFALLATLVASGDEPEDTVYELVRTIFEHLDELRRLHPALAGLAPARMVGAGLAAPLHPGARRYYAERGWLKDTRQ